MKKLLISVAVTALAAVAYTISGCGGGDKPTWEDVKSKIQTSESGSESYISEKDYLELSEEFGEDTIGFHQYLVDLLSDNDGSDVKVYSPMEAPALPLAVNIYLDNTGSMKGYFSGNINEIPEIIQAINGVFKPQAEVVQAYYVSDKGIVASTADDLINGLKNKKVSFPDAYTMDGLIDSIAARINSDKEHRTVSFFITDAIPSFKNADIKKNPEINVQEKNRLQNKMAEAISKLPADKHGVSIYRLNSKFDGNYATYQNKSVKLPNAERPYYVIAIGDKTVLGEFAGKNDNGEYSGFKSDKHLHAITSYSTPHVEVVGAKEGTMQEGFVLDEDTKNIAINVNMGTVPEYARVTKNDLAGAEPLPFELKVNGKDVTDEYRAGSNLDVDGDILVIRQSAMPGSEETVEIRFKNQVSPAFIAAYSTADDKAINANDPDQLKRTFNLDAVANGLLKGISGKNSETYLGETVKFTIKED